MSETETRDYATDWDNTVTPHDSGYLLMQAAADYQGDFQYVPDKVDEEVLPADGEFDENYFNQLIGAVDEEKPRGHSNPLVTFLYHNPEFAEHAEQKRHDLDIPSRTGFDAFLEYRAEQEDAVNVLSTAGYHPVAQAQTNGHFDGIIAGDFDQQPFYNGQGEKGENLKQFYNEELGREPQELVYTGDSNGDIEAIRLAHETDGFGIAVGPTVEQAQDKVDEATLYIGDPNSDHHTTGWVLNQLTMPGNPASIEELAKLGLGKPEGRVVAGELADGKKESEIDDVKDYLEGVRQSLE
jgi:phosphoglycolate phosphatase-like HAD superfamily hydrolase